DFLLGAVVLLFSTAKILKRIAALFKEVIHRLLETVPKRLCLATRNGADILPLIGKCLHFAGSLGKIPGRSQFFSLFAELLLRLVISVLRIADHVQIGVLTLVESVRCLLESLPKHVRLLFGNRSA